jgi:hypothetical protein
LTRIATSVFSNPHFILDLNSIKDHEKEISYEYYDNFFKI